MQLPCLFGSRGFAGRVIGLQGFRGLGFGFQQIWGLMFQVWGIQGRSLSTRARQILRVISLMFIVRQRDSGFRLHDTGIRSLFGSAGYVSMPLLSSDVGGLCIVEAALIPAASACMMIRNVPSPQQRND